MVSSVVGMQALGQQWKGGLVGLLLGMCIVYVLLATSSLTIAPTSDCNPLEQQILEGQRISDFHHAVSQPPSGSAVDLEHVDTDSVAGQIRHLLSLWEASSTFFPNSFHRPLKQQDLAFFVPKAPHLENCEERTYLNEKMDSWGRNGTLPYWTLWKGEGFGLRMNVLSGSLSSDMNSNIRSSYPPWVEGADEGNLPLTRQVQVDIWKHQHPQNCNNASLRFLLADWETDPGLGIGAQITSMAGMLSIAITEQRILVSDYYNRADHEECSGTNRARWSCYFLAETSKECQDRARFLASQSSAWHQGLITSKNNYTSKQIWAGKPPGQWGKPWKAMQPTTQIDGKLLIHHRAEDRRWWRAQAVRYLMRFPSNYMCLLVNEARHKAFGVEAAKIVLDTLQNTLPKDKSSHNESDIEQYVWKVYKPWLPRPLVSIHVRQGDKAKEMTVAGFEEYMKLAHQLRDRFPEVRNIWLSTEMQEVIEESKAFSRLWNIYYTNVSRQTGNTSMQAYEASLGRVISTNNPLVNFLLSVEADFFIGALGSSWSYHIDGMRATGGKVMAGYLSVNKYRFW